MVFSNTTDKNGAIQQIEANTNLGDAGITGDATLFAQFTAQYNNYYMKGTGIIVRADGIWQWDDTNHTDTADATTDLNADQSDYQVLNATPSAGQDWLEPTGVNIMDASGQWYKLHYKAQKNFGTPKKQREITTGQPSTYYFKGTQIFMDAMPNYSQTAGLEILFSRAPLVFTVADTTKRLGLNTLFHEYPVLGCTYWWEKYRGVGNPEQTKRDLMEMEKDMGKFYNNRHRYEPTTMQRPPSQSRRAYK